jgi:hypothetical protein
MRSLRVPAAVHVLAAEELVALSALPLLLLPPLPQPESVAANATAASPL